MIGNLIALAAGAIFAVGLAVGGMTDPHRVKGFLDAFGRWDPTLVFVMAGAVGTSYLINYVAARRNRPVFEGSFSFPPSKAVDAKLIGGAAVFGVGWGLSGFCPGPAVAGIVGGFPSILVFAAAMVSVMLAYDRLFTPSFSAARPAIPSDG